MGHRNSARSPPSPIRGAPMRPSLPRNPGGGRARKLVAHRPKTNSSSSAGWCSARKLIVRVLLDGVLLGILPKNSFARTSVRTEARVQLARLHKAAAEKRLEPKWLRGVGWRPQPPPHRRNHILGQTQGLNPIAPDKCHWKLWETKPIELSRSFKTRPAPNILR